MNCNYLQQHLQDIYEKLTEDLEQEYSMASNVGTVYLPEIGINLSFLQFLTGK